MPAIDGPLDTFETLRPAFLTPELACRTSSEFSRQADVSLLKLVCRGRHKDTYERCELSSARRFGALRCLLRLHLSCLCGRLLRVLAHLTTTKTHP